MLINKSFYSAAILSGTTIGVGLFSLPYITSKVGIWIMLAWFAVLSIVVIAINLIYGQLAVQTPDYKRLPGFAKIYLGPWAEKLALITTVCGLLGTILAYLIVGGEFLNGLLNLNNVLLCTLIYFFFGAILIFQGGKFISMIALISLSLFIIILLAIFAQSQPFLNLENLFVKGTKGINNLFLPYGPILFSLWGATLIPEAEELLGKNKSLLKKIIPIATLLPLLVYLSFIFLIVGVTGSQTTESAMIGLQDFLGPNMAKLGLFFGIIATFTPYIALGLMLKQIFWYDLKIPKNTSWFITCFIPLILFLAGVKSLILVISIVGGIITGISGMLILLMYLKTRPDKKRLVVPLFLVLLGGVIYEIIYFIK